MRDAASRLAHSGFKVFPVEAGGKRPLIPGWNTEATTSQEKIGSWWTQWPNANVGVHTQDLLVVDVDPKNGGEIPEGCPATFTVDTPSGGYHLYYTKPGGVKNSAGKVAQGVDIKSDNGYVVGPGSTFKGREYTIGVKIRPANAPPWLIEKAGAVVTVKTTHEGGFYEDQEAAVLLAVDAMLHHPPAVQGDGGDHKTFAAVCKVRDMGVDPHHALEALEEWNQRCEPPWDTEDLLVKVDNAYSYASKGAGNGVALDSDFDTSVELNLADAPTLKHGPVLIPLLSKAPDIDVQQMLKTNYLVKGWLPRESNAMLFGEWGGGKTFSALHMAAHIAAGAPWFGLRVRQGGVLYVGYEGSRGISCRVHALRLTYPDFDWKAMPLAWFMLNRPIVNGGEGQELMGKALHEFRDIYGDLPALVIIDPLRDALGGSDSDADLTAPYLKYARELITRMRCTVLTVHHPGHGDKERGRGDSGIEASMDTVIRLDKDAGTIETKKQRDGGQLKLSYALAPVDIGIDDDGDMLQSCVVEKIEDNPRDPKLTNAQRSSLDSLRDFADDAGYLRNSDVMDALPRMDASARRKLVRVLASKGYLTAINNGWGLASPDTGVDIFD